MYLPACGRKTGSWSRIDSLLLLLLTLTAVVVGVVRGEDSQRAAGLTYKVYDNAALAGPPSMTGMSATAELWLTKDYYYRQQRQDDDATVTNTTTTSDNDDDDGTGCFLSGELVGTITFANSGNILTEFDCHFENTSTGFVWIDGHLVCHDPNTHHARQQVDNPLPIRNKKSFPFRAQITSNDTSSDTTCATLKVFWKQEPLQNNTMVPLANDTKATESSVRRPLLSSTFQLMTTTTTTETTQKTNGVTFAPRLPPAEEQRDELQRGRLQQGWGAWLRSNILSVVKLPEGLVVTPQLCSSSSNNNDNNMSLSCVDLAIPDDDNVRVDLYAYDHSYVGFNITIQQPRAVLSMEYSAWGDQKENLYYLMTLLECHDDHDDDDDTKQQQHHHKQKPSCYHDLVVQFDMRYAWFRPGTVSDWNDEYSQMTFTTPGLGDIDLTIVYDDDDDDNEDEDEVIGHDHGTVDASRHLLMTPQQQSRTAPLFNLGRRRSPLRGGGRRRRHGGESRNDGDRRPKLGFVAGSKEMMMKIPSMKELETTIRTNKETERKRIRDKFGPSKADVAEAIQCAVMWTYIYNPAENGPFMPVSRWSNWDFVDYSGARSPDWYYVIFDWDNFFASLLAGLDNRDIAYSNIFQVVKSKTAEGFIPNFSGGGAKSQDRTEPPVGAKVMLELFRKYNDTWAVEVVFDDLLDWNNWFLENRVLQPRGLIGLGSYYHPHKNWSHAGTDGEFNDMQAARWESGLDNSPMYDGDLYDNQTTHMMLLYDVGMSSLFTQEAYSLAELADAIGREPKVGKLLRDRGDAMRDLIGHHLWDSKRQVFANRFARHSNFSDSISPTSFYPLAVGAGSKEQANSMVDAWMFNSSRFCISQAGDFQGNDPDTCYWGLPSISADDPAYMEPGVFNYWRGLVWGPMSQLVYWSLQDATATKNGKTTTNRLRQQPVKEDSVTKARKALCKQMEALMMSQWVANRNICENYDPKKDASQCSGTRYYHWGALNGLIGMVDDGFW